MSYYISVKEEYMFKISRYKSLCKIHRLYPKYECSEVAWWQKEVEFCDKMIALGR